MTLVHDLVLPKPGKPLCLVLHGLGDCKEGWKPVAPMFGLDGWGWAFVQAPRRYGEGWSWFELDIERMQSVPSQVAHSHALVLELLDHLERTQGLPCERIALLGFSQGCSLALETVLRHPRRLLATLAISGWVNCEADWPAGFGAALPGRLPCFRQKAADIFKLRFMLYNPGHSDIIRRVICAQIFRKDPFIIRPLFAPYGLMLLAVFFIKHRGSGFGLPKER